MHSMVPDIGLQRMLYPLWLTPGYEFTLPQYINSKDLCKSCQQNHIGNGILMNSSQIGLGGTLSRKV